MVVLTSPPELDDSEDSTERDPNDEYQQEDVVLRF